MDRLSLRGTLNYIKYRLPVETGFSILLLSLVFLLLSIVVLTSEEERFIKNLFVYYVVAVFIILISVLQASLCLKKTDKKKIKYRNLATSKNLERIINQNILGIKAGNDDLDTKRYRSVLFNQNEAEKFYTPKADFGTSAVRYRNTSNRNLTFGDSNYNDRFVGDRKFNTPTKGRYDDTIFSKPFDAFGRDLMTKSGVYSTAFDKSSIRDFDNSFAPRFSLQPSKIDRSADGRRSNLFGYEGKTKDSLKAKRLEDFENKEESKIKYSETIEKLQIKHRMKSWMRHTKEWIQEGILQKLVKLDLDNLIDLCRVFSRCKYCIIFSKEDYYNKETRGTLPYEYEKIFKHYYNQSYKLIDLKDILGLKKRQSAVGELYDKYYFTFSDGNILKIEDSLIKGLDKLLLSRKDIERYYNINGFGSECRLYVYQRIEQLSRSVELSVKYNYGEPFNGIEWTPRLPTDAHIIMWVFLTCFERNDSDTEGEYNQIIRIFYDYMEYNSNYKNNDDMLAIWQVAPNSYAPFYKVISGYEELNCIPEGDNVFNAILFFLYMLKIKKNGIYKANHQALLEDIFK